MARSGTSTVDRSSPVALGCASIGMLRVTGIIFLGLIVSLSNAYCPCVPLESKTNQAEKQSHAEHAKPSHPGCQGHGKEQTPDQGAPHDCGHCTGTVIAGTPSGKQTTVISSLSLVVVSVQLISNVTFDGSPFLLRISHCGLSPPVPRPTLLALATSFLH